MSQECTVTQDPGLHLMRFVMMESNLEREEALAFLKALADALGDFVCSWSATSPQTHQRTGHGQKSRRHSTGDSR